jgi:hypothetical protein
VFAVEWLAVKQGNRVPADGMKNNCGSFVATLLRMTGRVWIRVSHPFASKRRKDGVRSFMVGPAVILGRTRWNRVGLLIWLYKTLQ